MSDKIISLCWVERNSLHEKLVIVDFVFENLLHLFYLFYSCYTEVIKKLVSIAEIWDSLCIHISFIMSTYSMPSRERFTGDNPSRKWYMFVYRDFRELRIISNSIFLLPVMLQIMGRQYIVWMCWFIGGS